MIERINNLECDQALVNFDEVKKLIDGNNLVVLDFSASWCGPCKKLYPIIKKLSGKYENISFFKVDIGKQDADNLGDLYNISSLPTVLFFHNGQELDRQEGMKPGASNIITALAELISKDECECAPDTIVTDINEYLKSC